MAISAASKKQGTPLNIGTMSAGQVREGRIGDDVAPEHPPSSIR